MDVYKDYLKNFPLLYLVVRGKWTRNKADDEVNEYKVIKKGEKKKAASFLFIV